MKFTIYTLGCKVNTYESNVMSDLLKNAGYLEVKNQEASDICIINTCTVTNQADHKSQKIIRRAISENPNALIVVCGCLVQTSKEVVEGMENIDVIIGNKKKSEIVSYIETALKEKKQIVDWYDISNTSFETMKLNNFNKTRAFVKIQDGCNNFCSYCIIPYSRGNVRSKKREDVLEEVQTLIQDGHKEIVLTGIHTGNYGAEFTNYDFANLLSELVMLPGLERLRISSIEMNEINDRVLTIMKENPILVDHMHIPLQSGSDTILMAMNRKYTKQELIEKINQIRKIRPEISITTDVIVGFPGESDELFLETIETIKTIGFSKLHVFPYSKRKGTVAAEMENQVDDIVKKERAHQLLSLSKELEKQYQAQFVGKTVSVLFETYKNEILMGHTSNYLPVKVKGPNMQNEVSLVTLTKQCDGILYGELTKE